MYVFGNGISLSMGFDLKAPLPLDYRSVVDTIDELINLSESNLVCNGQTTYVEETKLFYQYTGEGELNGWAEVCSLAKLKDVINVTKDELTIKMENLEEGLRNKISVTAKELRSEFSDIAGGDFSSIIQDVNSIRTEISALEDRLNSKVIQTADSLRLEMINKDDEVKSIIIATAKELRSEFSDIAEGNYSSIIQDLKGIHADIEEMNGTFNNKIDITAQGLKANIDDLETGLRSEIEASAKNLELKFSEIAGGDFSTIYQDLKTIRTEISGLDNSLTSKIEQTAGTIRTEMTNIESDLRSEIELTAENLESKFSEIAGGDYSAIYQDLETIRAEINGLDGSLTSRIEQTAGTIRTEMNSMNEDLRSEIELSAKNLESKFSEIAGGDFSAIYQDLETIRTEINGLDGRLDSKIEQTASTIRAEMNSIEEGLTSQIELTAKDLESKFSEIAGGDYSAIYQDIETIRVEISDFKNQTESKFTQLSDSITTEISNVQANMTSKIEQTSDALTLKFNEGYNQGITEVNKDGITVMHNNMSGYSKMTADGFYVNNGTENVISITSDGSLFKGRVTMTGGSVPASLLTGTIDMSSLNSETKNAISRVEDWAIGDISGSTTIDGGYLQTNTVVADKIAAGAITTEKISANAITTTQIAADAVTATQIAAGAITADKIDAGAITADKIATGTITATQLASNSITADKITAGAITTDKLDAGSITANKIASGAITADKLDINGTFDLAGTFTCYKTPEDKTNYLHTSGAMMFGYNETGGENPVFASGLWTDENLGYFSVGYTRADVTDENGCLWLSSQNNNNGGRLTFSKLINSQMMTTNLYFQKDGAIDFATNLYENNSDDDYYCYRFDAGVSARSFRCDNLRTHNIYPRYNGSFNIGSPSARYVDVFCDSVSTTNTEMKIGTIDGDGSWAQYGPLLINSSTGYIYPLYNGNLSFGTNNLRFHSIYLVNSPSVSSDVRAKTDIHYLDSTKCYSRMVDGRKTINMNITTKDMYDFVKDDLKLASYRYNKNIEKEDTSVNYGFIAQDILYTKVGSEIIQLEDKNDLDSNLSYDQGNYINVLAGALQTAIRKIEELENKIEELENK